ncbi:DUF1365 domain-containing protein [Alteromonas sp. a30]|uniref:DUF1365 domain-containing protein n=1 Tax=Alteromonas sp. a30 TaxID=2730917 RepID=UPI00228240DA|nr:DUF1365 domain-containing protein [Alteromonas sp. a30]MCY7297114.1 DUF1365 domain-containing protein [Alteromonas sp. a30]
MNNAIYHGQIHHARFIPKKHSFNYHLFLFWLDLADIESTCETVSGLNYNQKGWVQFKREDYLDSPEQPLHIRALERMSELAGKRLQGKVFFLGQLRMLGWYFSPVNFYYLQQEDGHFSHVLAEVSNTPWNERQHYLVALPPVSTKQLPAPTQKTFHVSPFNPMNMTYHWQISQPDQHLNLSITCSAPTGALAPHQQQKHFIAGMNMQREALTSSSLQKHLRRIPSLAIKTVAGIYWQAFKLLLKRVPIYSKPAQD